MSEILQTPTELLRAGGVGLATGFCLDCARLITELLDEDLVPSVVFLGILSANAATYDRTITDHPDAAVPISDIPREGISVYRLARNLSIPYETTRRHAARLLAKGAIARDGDGLTIAPSLNLMARSMTAAEEIWRFSRQLRDDLQALGLETPAAPVDADQHEKRRVGRLGNAFFLSGLKIAVDATATDLVTALIFLAIARVNQADGPPDTILPDDQVTPVSIYAVSRQMRLPYETVRRHVGILVGENLCRKVTGGLIVPLSVTRSQPVLDASTQAWTLMSEFMTAAFGPMTIRSAA